MNPLLAKSGAPHQSNFEKPISVVGIHHLLFTKGAFQAENKGFAEILERSDLRLPARAVVFADSQVIREWPDLEAEVRNYAEAHPDLLSILSFEAVNGGEASKNGLDSLNQVLTAINREGICRKSLVVAIGGGAVLDVVGYAAAIAHRGVPLVRFPTTTLAQGDSGVGVKNGINAFGKKNFLGTFDVPLAVINDFRFLKTLSDRDWRCGFSEAVKVGLIKDREFFETVRSKVAMITNRSLEESAPIIQKSAEIHYRHIVEGGDPFEKTFARPLDFGHWAAHKIEQMSDYQVRHGEGVAIGIALDSTYSNKIGLLPEDELKAVLDCLSNLGFGLYHPVMEQRDVLFEGIEEFRQHLGGQLAIPLLEQIGKTVTAEDIDLGRMNAAIDSLAALG
jgi:3-dehydroquinate synthase